MIVKIPATKKIDNAFFIDFKLISDVSRELYGKKRIGYVSSHFKKLNDLGYIDKDHIIKDKVSNKGNKHTQVFTGYRLNLNPYFDHVKSKASVTFNKLERDMLEFIFSYKLVREIVCRHEDILEGITIFLERAFLYKTDTDWPHRISQFFRKAYFVKNKKYVELDIDTYMDRLKEIEKFEKISHDIFNRIKDKVKVISSFTEQDYLDLTTETDLRKYQYMPNLSDIKKAKNNTDKIKLVRLWSKIYFHDEIPEKW